MKGIILAGGAGTRLSPLTNVVCKQLLPVYDKPMIFYPLSTLLLAGIREILIVINSHEKDLFQRLLADGSQLGVNIEYAFQDAPNGIPEALILGEKFIGDDDVCLILGDNIFHGDTFVSRYLTPVFPRVGATIFGYQVVEPSRYGVVELGRDGQICSIEEKPAKPKSNFAIPGLYVFDQNAPDIAKTLRKSNRNELEIVDLIKHYQFGNQLNVRLLGRGVAWLDMGTAESLLHAANYVEALEIRQGLKIGCLEEIAFERGYISLDQLGISAERYRNSSYGHYLNEVIQRHSQPYSKNDQI